MKRKLLCVFFMIVGAAVIFGTILLSLGRPGHSDMSPALMLIILSIITIVVAARNVNNKPDGLEFDISRRERFLLRVFHAVCILAILVCLAFIVITFFLTAIYWLQNMLFLMVLAAAGIVSAALGLKVRPSIYRHDIAKAVVALIMAAALCFVYFYWMPKYSVKDGVNIFRSDKEYARKDFMGSFEFYPNWDITDPKFGGNPFYDRLYGYNSDTYGYDAGSLHTAEGYIQFNPATGAYEYMRTQKVDKTYNPGEYPEFNWHFMYDKDGQHDAVLNLFFRELWPNKVTTDNDPVFSVSSGEWDEKMKDVMYPHNFPEDEARAYLQSIGEEALKTKILEQIDMLSKFKNNTIDVYFFGIDIAAYKNGEIVLKI